MGVMTSPIDSLRIRECLDTRYEEYALSIGRQIREAAITVYIAEEKKDNEGRVSEFTPPSYISQFRVDYYRAQRQVQISNDDPGWWLVEFGYHPGGDKAAYVRPYKPLRRGLLTVVSVHAG